MVRGSKLGYVHNRFPTFVVKDITPQETWNAVKPSVEYFYVFGNLAHVHVSDAKRGKLDDKIFPYVLLGVSKKYKGYRLFDPIAKKIFVSRDVIFKEGKQWDWDWDVSYDVEILLDLEWEENAKKQWGEGKGEWQWQWA